MNVPIAQPWNPSSHVEIEPSVSRTTSPTVAPRSTTATGCVTRPAIAILGVPFDNVTTAEAIGLIEQMVASGEPHYLVTANVDFLVQAQSDIELRRILFDAHLVLCDGTPLLWASRLLGNALPERVAGADLVPLLIRVAAQRKYRLFFLGATPESAERAVTNLAQQHKGLIIAGHYSPPFNKLLEMDHEEIKRRILEARPDLLFVSFGCPKQEKWIAMHYRALGVPVVAGVGATIDFLAGGVKRAPVWMQRIGAEWLFRLAQEPRRLFRRYAKDVWVFGAAIFNQWRELQSGSKVERAGAQIQQVSDSVFQMIAPPERLDLCAVREGAVPLEQIVDDGRHCLLHMSNVAFIDSTGVGLLIQLQKRLRANGCHLILLAPSRSVQRALELMRLESFFATAQKPGAAEPLLKFLQREPPGRASIDANQPFNWEGEVTAANAEAIWSLTRAHLVAAADASQPQVTINLSAVRFLDSSGLGVMVRTKKLAQRHGTKLVFANPSPAVTNVLQISRMEEFLLGHSGKKR